MKQKFLIVASLIFALLGAFALKSTAQERPIEITLNTQTTDTAHLIVIGDQTTLQLTKTGAVIKSLSDSMVYKLLVKWGPRVTKATWTNKKDRHGPYKAWSIYIKKEDIEPIRKWAKTNL